jgi:lipid-A-disaccharide synthase
MAKILMISGESSGDLQGARLARELLVQRPDLEILGTGGPHMREAGVDVRFDFSEHGSIGPLAAMAQMKHYTSVFRKLMSLIRTERPDQVILIDFPDFNMRFAERVKDEGIPIVYYISPQVWAWRKGRVKTLERLVERMIVIFDFERDLYRSHGVDAVWVGHPLTDALESAPSREEARRALGIAPDERVIRLLPGSRGKEVDRLLSIQFGAAEKIQERLGPTTFLIAAAPHIDPERLTPPDSLANARVIKDQTYTLMRASDFLLCKSGTSTLEAGALGTPLAVIYKVNPVEAMIVRTLVKMDLFGMVNILAGSEIMPELLQEDATPKRISDTVCEIFEQGKLERMRTELVAVRERLGEPGAATRAAAAVLEVLDRAPANTL